MQQLLHKLTLSHKAKYPVVRHLEDTPDRAHDMAFNSLGLLVAPLHGINTSAPGFRRDSLAADDSLRVPHAAVDVDVLGRDPQRTVRWALEPTPDLPHEVQEDQQRAGEVCNEEAFRLKRGPTDGVQCGVEGSHESKDVD
jgi:hypothetical protein